jgi:hypothetical protein
MEVGSSPLINDRIELGNLAWARALSSSQESSAEHFAAEANLFVSIRDFRYKCLLSKG